VLTSKSTNEAKWLKKTPAQNPSLIKTGPGAEGRRGTNVPFLVQSREAPSQAGTSADQPKTSIRVASRSEWKTERRGPEPYTMKRQKKDPPLEASTMTLNQRIAAI